MDPLKIIEKYFEVGSKAYDLYVAHVSLVTARALTIAKRVPELKPNLQFIYEAGMLHDIGIVLVHAPGLGCEGDAPYMAHGYLGRELLEKEGLPKHALVCERHTGVGLRTDETQKLGLPERDMLPLTIEEEIICFADEFFTKDPNHLIEERPLPEIRKGLARFGDAKVKMFDSWCKKFKEVED
jgi:uncharacterized protein